jgi:hypothetical protein
MSSSTLVPAAKKSAYQRPYKSRSQRREIDRRKHDETKDRKFLIRIAAVVGLIVVLAVAFAITGMTTAENDMAAQAVLNR